MYDIYEYTKKQSKLWLNKLKKIPPYQLLGLALLPLLTYVVYDDEFE